MFILQKSLITIVLSLVAQTALAGTDPFYWDARKGLVEANTCNYKTYSNVKLAFVKGGFLQGRTGLENEDGKVFADIGNGTLVRIISSNEETSKVQVEVIGGNKENDTDAKKGDLGFVPKNTLRPIQSRGIKINEDVLGLSAGTLLVTFGETSYLRMNCREFSSEKEYLVFNMYRPGETNAIQLAVNTSDTSLFDHISTLDKEQIYNLIPTFINDDMEMKALIASTEKLDQKNPPPATETIPDPDEDDNENDDHLKIQNGVETIICSASGSINVRDESLSNVIYTAQTGDQVKFYQSFEPQTIKGVINGVEYTFVKVEFETKAGEPQKIGYVASTLIKPKSECEYASSYIDDLLPTISNMTGLNDPNCCTFPTMKRVTVPFSSGQRSFGWARAGGKRVHAANDLYRFKDEPIRAVAPGIVIRPLYRFYGGTYALEVVHSGGFVVRYGEITGVVPEGINFGKVVQMGDRVGYMGVVNSGCCSPMLHFELYSGKLKGPLTQFNTEINGKYYNRRQDLLNPTPYLLKWQNVQFRK